MYGTLPFHVLAHPSPPPPRKKEIICTEDVYSDIDIIIWGTSECTWNSVWVLQFCGNNTAVIKHVSVWNAEGETNSSWLVNTKIVTKGVLGCNRDHHRDILLFPVWSR